ncbi:glutamine synthetase family protein [Coralliovum pocilloporae]|uniref:glutamine synthetase family protein n=1 Tax=Coralliovum pocilloporae TaxID=3066369 RepID=UPI0033069F7E
MLASTHSAENRRLFAEEVDQFLADNPDIEKFEMLFSGLCGVLRGKWLPREGLRKLAKGGVRLPRSTSLLDIWGYDVPTIGRSIELGDPDGLCRGVPGSLQRVPWLDTPTAQVLVTMSEEDGADACIYDPRTTLSAMCERIKAMGYTPVAATELEFYFVDPEPGEYGHPLPPMIPGLKRRLDGSQVYDMNILARFEPVMNEITEACRLQNIPADTTICEFGPGQFEINLSHVDDVLRAADQSVMFKRVVRQVAWKHGLDVTFMAKPYADHTGNGLHVHMSLLDEEGNNVFDGGKEGEANDLLRHAIGGMLASSRQMQAILAPHRNSYRRFQPGSYAPVTPCWGYDHRAAAIRVPESVGPATRFEHRIAGADANPHLVLAAILAGVIDGIERKVEPDPAIQELSDVDKYEILTANWELSVDAFEASDLARQMFGETFCAIYTEGRRAEQAVFAATITDMEYRTYLQKV